MQAHSGYTLTELLVVVTIVSILMGIGVPSYKYVTNSNRVSAEVNALLGDMQYARSEAIKQGLTVTVCPSSNTNQNACDANSMVWNKGWIVFTDLNSDATVDSGDTILRVQKAFSSTTDSFKSDNSLYSVTFNREGFAAGLPPTTAGYVTVTLHTQPAQNQWTRCLQITTVGAMTTQRYGDPNGNCQ